MVKIKVAEVPQENCSIVASFPREGEEEVLGFIVKPQNVQKKDENTYTFSCIKGTEYLAIVVAKIYEKHENLQNHLD